MTIHIELKPLKTQLVPEGWHISDLEGEGQEVAADYWDECGEYKRAKALRTGDYIDDSRFEQYNEFREQVIRLAQRLRVPATLLRPRTRPKD